MKHRPISAVVINSTTGDIWFRGKRIQLIHPTTYRTARDLPNSKGSLTLFAVFHLLWKVRKDDGIRASAIYNQLYQLRPSCDKPKFSRCGEGSELAPIVKTFVSILRRQLKPYGLFVERCGVWGNCSYRLVVLPDSKTAALKERPSLRLKAA